MYIDYCIRRQIESLYNKIQKVNTKSKDNIINP